MSDYCSMLDTLERGFNSLFADLRPLDPRDRPDAREISRAVRRYAKLLGLDPSNTEAAVSTALREPEGRGMFCAINAGKARADALYVKQAPRRPTPEAA